MFRFPSPSTLAATFVISMVAVAAAAMTHPFAARADAAESAAKVAICHVCRVHHGEASPEPVKASRTYDGKTYGFCSEKCAKTFDADPAAYVPSEFPKPAPALDLKTLDGKPITWESLRGKVVLVDFWATWCMPCRKSMPDLQKLHDAAAAKGAMVLGVSVDQGGAKKVKRFLASKRYTYPMAIDSEQNPTHLAFGVKAIPAAFLVDGRGMIIAEWTGLVNVAEIRQELDRALDAAKAAGS